DDPRASCGQPAGECELPALPRWKRNHLGARGRPRALLAGHPAKFATARSAPTSVDSRRTLERLVRKRRGDPEQLDLALEQDSEVGERPPARLDNERDCVHSPRAVDVLDEVRVPGRDASAADTVSLEPAGVQHSTSAELMVGILEDTPERPPVRRLGRLPPRVQVGDGPLDLLRGPRGEPELDARDDVARTQRRMTVRELELVPSE